MQAVRRAPRAAGETTITVGPLTLDLQGYAVTVDGTDVFLTVSVFVLLGALARNPYRVLDRASLWALVQSGHVSGEPESRALRAIDRHVAHLRKKLGAAGYEGIQTMRNVGYRLVP